MNIKFGLVALLLITLALSGCAGYYSGYGYSDQPYGYGYYGHSYGRFDFYHHDNNDFHHRHHHDGDDRR